MKYALNSSSSTASSSGGLRGLRRLLPLLAAERRNLLLAGIGVLVNSATTLIAPIIIGKTIDGAIASRDYHGVLIGSVVLIGIFLIGLVASYTQTIRMGTVGRRVLFRLRNDIFTTLQELPVAFFNQNKVGDLISRINNDTDRLNMFFAQALMQFVANFFLMLGAGFLLLSLDIRLGAASLVPALGVVLATQLVSPWIKKTNMASLQSLGNMSGEIQESLSNFKVIVAFNRLDYFRQKFTEANTANYTATVRAGLANGIFTPMYALAANAGQLIVLAYGIILIQRGHLTIGLLVGFLLYVNNFYMPLRQLASVWSSLQQSLAALDRIFEVLALTSDLPVLPLSNAAPSHDPDAVLTFHNVSFRYADGADVLERVRFSLQRGKTYALVGPTGGGKTTTASLMARLYDPTEGTVELFGRDIRTYTAEERAKKIGFILQEPLLFNGTVLDNLFYGHPNIADTSTARRLDILDRAGLRDILTHLEGVFDAPVRIDGDSVSLGQRQLIAFVRAILRKPEILILDEATANIDTVTEQLLQRALSKLPVGTTTVIIAHRLNTIENADEIFFVNHGTITPAGSFEHAIELLMHGKRDT